jgi:hypothetical protein
MDLKAPVDARKPVAGQNVGPTSRPASWWTARARAGEVAPGFTRAEIMRPAKDDPRREGGLFARVEGLLRQLSDSA